MPGLEQGTLRPNPESLQAPTLGVRGLSPEGSQSSGLKAAFTLVQEGRWGTVMEVAGMC